MLEAVVRGTSMSPHSLLTAAVTSLTLLALDAVQSVHSASTQLWQLVLTNAVTRVQEQMLMHTVLKKEPLAVWHTMSNGEGSAGALRPSTSAASPSKVVLMKSGFSPCCLCLPVCLRGNWPAREGLAVLSEGQGKEDLPDVKVSSLGAYGAGTVRGQRSGRHEWSGRVCADLGCVTLLFILQSV